MTRRIRDNHRRRFSVVEGGVPHLDGAPGPDGLSAAEKKAVDQLMSIIEAQPVDERVSSMRDGYRMIHGDVRDPLEWIALLTVSAGEVARSAHAARTADSAGRAQRLREAIAFCEQTAACALELGEVLRMERQEPPL